MRKKTSAYYKSWMKEDRTGFWGLLIISLIVAAATIPLSILAKSYWAVGIGATVFSFFIALSIYYGISFIVKKHLYELKLDEEENP